jgi:choline-sulfatase
MKVPGILFFCLALCALSWSQAPAPKAARPNVFLITIDTLRADHVHCFGYQQIQTPALDSLAKDGIRFSQAFTPSPITNTSHTTILTGLLPSSHGVTDFAVPLASSHSTWAELLHKQGYHTAAFIGAIILDSKTLAPGLDRGFDYYDNFPEHSRNKSRWGRLERRGMDVVQRAEMWLTAHRAAPYFVWVHLYDPHDPYEPPPPYSQIYKDRLYDGEIAYADSALAHFLAYLKKQGWYDNSLIVVVGDHGEGLGEHHEDTHGIFLYDTTTHVPLLIKLLQHRDAGNEVAAQVRTTDILATVLDVAGFAVPEHLDGQSLKPYFTRTETANRTAFGETDYPLRFGWAPLRSVREDGFKFIEAPRPELYDLKADPHEAQNQYQPWNSTVQQLRAKLAKLREQAAAPTQASPGAVGQGTTDELKALGYLGPADALSSTNVPEPSLLPDPKDKIEEQNLLHTAMLAGEDNRPQQAREALEKVLAMDPKSPTALLQLGQLELTSKDFVKAADYLGRALHVRANDTTAAFDYAQALEKLGKLTEACEVLETSLKGNPSQFPARLLLGQIYLGLHDPKNAQDQLEAALLLEPKNVEAALNLARAQLDQEAFAEAQTTLEPLAQSPHPTAEMYELLAKAYAGLNKKNEAYRAESRAKALRTSAKPQ